MQKLATAYDLQTRLTVITETTQREFASLTDVQLRWQPTPRQWSIVECLQHVNLAERFYIRNIQHKVDKLGLLQTNPTDQTLESDWIGKVIRYAVDPQVTIKLPTPGMTRPRPAQELVPSQAIAQFLELQTLLHTLLNKAVYLDWNQEKVMTLFGNWPSLDWLKIRLGDAFLMLVAHTERHMNQAMRVKTELDTFAKR